RAYITLPASASAATRDLPSSPTRRSSDLRSGPPRRPRRLPRRRPPPPPPRRPLRRPRQGGHEVNTQAQPHRGAESGEEQSRGRRDRKSTRLNSSHEWISYAVCCLKKKKNE